MSASCVGGGRLPALLAVVALAGALTPLVAQAQPGNYAGYWATGTFGAMRLQQSGGNVIGSYAFKGGQVSGQILANGDLVGIWTQNAASQYCQEARMGSHYWGRFKFQAVNDGSALVGYWGYCGADPASTWNAHR